MKEIVVISGKGGTGKTSVTSALAFVEVEAIVLADCDVDAADLHLVFHPQELSSEDFYSGLAAEINPELCIACGLCHQVCRFDAIKIESGYYSVDAINCEGCGYCKEVCPAAAITLTEPLVGRLSRSRAKTGSFMVHARLGIGADNSGKLVARVKKEAREAASLNHKEYILVDGSPGIGCPVISSLSGADLVVLVTEPSQSALSDLKRVWSLTEKFNLKCACIINKADINPDLTAQIVSFLDEQHIRLLSMIHYDNDFHKAVTNGQSLVEYDPDKWQNSFSGIWKSIKDML